MATGPVKEVVLTGDRVNLFDLPQIIHHEGDAGPYLTAAISFARDPSGEIWNCAYNRLMIKARDTTSIHLTLGKHLWEFQQVAEARGEPCRWPSPSACIRHRAGALAIGSIDEDERAIMGALLGEPLELVRAETSDVLVPAHAEMVHPGRDPARGAHAEGPFGEFTGYSLGERQREVLRVKAITHRHDAVFQDIAVAHLDHMLLPPSPWRRTSTGRSGPWCRRSGPCVCPARSPASCPIEQRLPGQAKNAILAVLGADLYMKRVVVVDHDVDLFDDRQMNWAIATRCQPDRDLVVVTSARGSDLDPSTREDGYTAKWGLDATAKPSLAAYTPRHRIPPAVWQRLDLEDFGL